MSFWWDGKSFEHIVTEPEDRPRFTVADCPLGVRINDPRNRPAHTKRIAPKHYKKRGHDERAARLLDAHRPVLER